MDTVKGAVSDKQNLVNDKGDNISNTSETKWPIQSNRIHFFMIEIRLG